LSFEDFEDSLVSKKAVRHDDNENLTQKLMQDIVAVEASPTQDSKCRFETIDAVE